MGRNTFRDSGFKNWDFSLDKNWRFRERFGAQFRAEFFNFTNHPNFANPFGGQNGWGHNDPSVPGQFGCGCATPGRRRLQPGDRVGRKPCSATRAEAYFLTRRRQHIEQSEV